jgi:fatty acid CoA ligase FadD21
MQNSSVVSLPRERAGLQNVADLVLLPPGSIPATPSGKIRRAACVDEYRQRGFTWLDA